MKFTLDYIKSEFSLLIANNYKFITCKDAFIEFISNKTVNDGHKTVINRVDVDFSLKKAAVLANMFHELGIAASFFVRLHAKEYNIFDFENYLLLMQIKNLGFEVGLHSEVVDQSSIWNQDPVVCLERDLRVLELIIDDTVYGVASHGSHTGLNNLHFWNRRNPQDFNLIYEAYLHGLFESSLYISDSCWTHWKSYLMGKVLDSDTRSPSEHAIDEHPLIYLLTHPDTYYRKHPYET